MALTDIEWVDAMEALREQARPHGITITRCGYKMAGRLYRIEDWDAVLEAIKGYDGIARQVERWLKGVR